MKEARYDTSALLRAIALLSKVNSEMPLSRAQVFLLVSRQPGIVVRDLMKLTGLSQSAAARSLAALGSKPVRGQSDPANLVKMVPDPEDSRRVQCWLTPKGETLAAQMLDAL